MPSSGRCCVWGSRGKGGLLLLRDQKQGSWTGGLGGGCSGGKCRQVYFTAAVSKLCFMRVLGWRMAVLGVPNALKLGQGRGCSGPYFLEPLSCVSLIPALAPDNPWAPGSQNPPPNGLSLGQTTLLVCGSQTRGAANRQPLGTVSGAGCAGWVQPEPAEGPLRCRICDAHLTSGTGVSSVCV